MDSTGKKYKKVLKDIADNLLPSDVGTLKFICQSKIGAAALNEIPNSEPLKFLKLFEEQQIISEQNLTCLLGILKKIQRVDLVMKIPDEFCQHVGAVDSAEMLCYNPHCDCMVVDTAPPYRMLLKTVADDLTSSNVRRIKLLLDIPAGIAEKLCDGQDLLTHLERSGKLSENNFIELKDLLAYVNKKDLIKKIEEFSINEDNILSGCPTHDSDFQQGKLKLGTPKFICQSKIGAAALNEIPNSQTSLPVLLNRDPASCYPMQRPYGFALVINNQEFTGTTSEGHILPERRGSHIDLENLVDLWAKLGFIVEKYENLKAHQILSAVNGMRNKIQTNQSSCFVCCIVTHGLMGRIYGSDSYILDIKDITDLFKESRCPELAGKPKLFFIQACRGRQRLIGRAPFTGSTNFSNTATPATQATCPFSQINYDADPYPAEVTSEAQYDMMNDSAFRHNADPNEAHFLLGYCTAPGYASMRSIDHGTWYVNALVKTFSQYYMSEDIMQMMVRVNGLVNKAYSCQGHKECPVPVFSLAKSLYFS